MSLPILPRVNAPMPYPKALDDHIQETKKRLGPKRWAELSRLDEKHNATGREGEV